MERQTTFKSPFVSSNARPRALRQVESSQEAETPGCASGAVLGHNSSLFQVPHPKLRGVLVLQISSGSSGPCRFTRCSARPQPFCVQPRPHSPLVPPAGDNKKLPLLQVLYKTSVWALARKGKFSGVTLLGSMDILPPPLPKKGGGEKSVHSWLCLKAQRSRNPPFLV